MADLTNNILIRSTATPVVWENGAVSQDVIGGVDERMLVLIRNLDAQTARVWLRKGDGIRGAGDDFYVDVAQNAQVVCGPFESSMFKDMDTGRATIDVTDDDATVSPSPYPGTITNVQFCVVCIP